MQTATQNQPETAALDIRPLATTIGAEIHGVDLTRPVDQATFNALYQALLDWKVIFFRDQDITTEQHIAFGRLFGDLEVHPFGPQNEANPEILAIAHNEERPGGENLWHSDVTWRQEPSLGSILRAREVPALGGDTLFSDMYAAYEGLTDEIKELIEGKTARHDFEGFRMRMRQRGVSEEEIEAFNQKYPNPHHPVVRTHPDTGRRAIYVNIAFAREIDGMDAAESARILKHLYDQAATPEYTCRFKWQNNSIAFWDNRACQHYASSDYWPAVRRMERVTVIGDKPYYDPDSGVASPWTFKGLVERRRNGQFQSF